MHPDFIEYRIENTNACGYRCVMCPREKQTRKIGFMPLSDFELILSKLPSKKPTVHLHGYGEPLLDKTLPDKIKLVKKNGFKNSFIITTLGVELSEKELQNIVSSGLDSMMISFYGFTKEAYKKVHNVDKLDLVIKNLRTLAKICQNLKSPLNRAIKTQDANSGDLIHLGSQKKDVDAQDVFFKEMISLGYQIGSVSSWHNYGSGRDYNSKKDHLCPVIAGKRSLVLNITWNLDVIPCCFDFDASIKFGNLRTQSLSEIYSSKSYNDFVLAHLRGDISSYAACKNCEKNDLGM